MTDRPERGPDGRFLPGCSGGPGYPHAGQVVRFRESILRASTPEQFERVWEALVERAEKGERWAVVEYLQRLLGPAKAAIDLEAARDAGEHERLELERRVLETLLRRPKVVDAKVTAEDAPRGDIGAREPHASPEGEKPAERNLDGPTACPDSAPDSAPSTDVASIVQDSTEKNADG